MWNRIELELAVIETLHPTAWQSGMEIRMSIEQRRHDVNIGQFYRLLRELSAQGLVEEREAEIVDLERLQKRGGRSEHEYRLGKGRPASDPTTELVPDAI